jgi:hypothetical protein
MCCGYAARRGLIGLLALVFPIGRAGDLLDRIGVGDAAALGLLADEQRERRVAAEIEIHEVVVMDHQDGVGVGAFHLRAQRDHGVAALLHVLLVFLVLGRPREQLKV